MAETWGNGHYSCYKCKHQLSKDTSSCKRCLTYTPMMQPYYQNWTKNDAENGDSIPIIHGKAELELHDKEIREKAIEEFAEAMKKKTEDYKFADFLESSWSHTWAILHFENIVNEIAEQLKGE